ncbi:MAG: oxidative damage protection protein [Gemmatimonadota bacterium]|nr:oxidative damage protection protein [Gemmatimonadota bacterium]
MAEEVTCVRCGETREGLDQPPYPDELGREIHEKVCTACWDEARNMQVMTINEYRLDLSDPRAQEILETSTRDFLGLEPAEAEPSEEEPAGE